ncbi:two-component system, AgrA family, sensor histidine kinase AgrC [Paenibacillus uliginis N3/975]|uniref:Two-component system, AgrA family, sensor histidine kinase AgrC n=1 Tax=Paenibacillus uliginis N3/975 TaxID=1313296 RepID=A0A1X7GVP8_9BACL|nr:GHKL domain-containing protein [Paenibacillus uliginis]SMF75496.1 two-component system, AgrA family, sensor histidine kinase AgrC [Paenibacillus uliginis N3/975]
MIHLIMAIQILSFFFIFQSISRYSFTIKEITIWLVIFLMIGFVSTYFIGVWGAVTLFFCFIGMSYFKNHKTFTALGVFYGAYALVMNSFLGYLAADPITWFVEFLFRQSSANIEYLPYLLTAMAPPIINEIGLRLVRRYFPQLNKDLIQESSKVILFPVIVLLIIIIISVYPILSIGNTTGEFSSFQRTLLLGMWLLFVIALLYMQFQYNHIQKREIERSKSEQLVQLKDYAAQLEKIYDEFRGFRHDYANILLTLEDGIYREDWDQVKQVYQQTVKPTRQLMRKNEYSFVKLRNLHVFEVKSILAAKILMAQQMKIDVTLEIEEPIHSIQMELISFTRILSILLDNAIEAAAETEDPKLWIVLLEDPTIQLIKIENSSREKVSLWRLEERGYSTKGKGRGLGLYNVQQMLKQNKFASLETEVQSNVFSQTLIIRKTGVRS